MTEKLNFWIQLTASIALIIGLALVVWELKQARDATLSELYSQGFQIISDSNNTILGEESLEVLIKACDSPEALSRQDLLLLQTYYEDLINRQRRILWINSGAGFYTDEIATSTNLGVWDGIFSTEVGRAYWHTRKVEPELKLIGDAALQKYIENETPDCGESLDKWVAQMQIKDA